MPMNSQERAEAIKALDGSSTLTDAIKAHRLTKMLPQMVKPVRRQLEQVDRIFQSITGANQAAKQTAFFDVVSALTDGDLILHDLGLFFDSCLSAANTHRQPGEDVATIPFTDADVTAYLP